MIKYAAIAPRPTFVLLLRKEKMKRGKERMNEERGEKEEREREKGERKERENREATPERNKASSF